MSFAEGEQFGIYDEFEEEMDNFWKDENPDEKLGDEMASFFDEEEGRYSSEGEFDLEGLEEEDEEEVNRILKDEEEQLMKESGLKEEEEQEEEGQEEEEEEKPPDKIILDRLNVDKLINMISKVRLAWPEDLPGYNAEEFATDAERAKFRDSYFHCSDKEKTVLWHAENFRRQYSQQFPRRRSLVIAPRNECGCQKLFPTFINPCVLGYPEFLDCFPLANFLKEFLAPEQMPHPPRFPDRIRSHLTVLKNRAANCFEFAVILATFLIGAGYDAYVVDGYASKTVCTMDATEDYQEPPEPVEEEQRPVMKIKEVKKAAEIRSNMDFLADLFKTDEEESAVRPVSPSKYRFKKAAPVASQYEAEMQKRESDTAIQVEGDAKHDDPHQPPPPGDDVGEEEGEETETATETEEMEKEMESEAEEEVKKIKKKHPPKTLREKFYRERTHAWILILPGKRDVEETFFIEPFSGSKFSIEDENFHGIETVFNQKNFWVNIQDPEDTNGDLSYDLNDASKWSKFLYEAEKKKKTSEEESSLFQDEEDDTPKQIEMLLDMPTSWTPDPDIPQEDYERKYPGGKKTFNYNDAIVELAAPYVNDDGLVKKVLKFNGTGRNPEDLVYIEELFENRQDKLKRRKWFRAGRLLHEYFDKGRRDALKEHVHISGKNDPNYPRNLYYYANAHPQCIAHRQIIRKGIIEHFEGRDDLLYFRSTTYGAQLCDTDPKPDSKKSKSRGICDKPEEGSKSRAKAILEMMKGDNGPGGKKRRRRKIDKIIEKYGRDDTKNFDEDIAEKHMLIGDGHLRILFHYGVGNLTRNTLEFFKPRGVNMDSTDFKPEDCVEYQADKMAPPMNVYKKFKLLQRMEADQRVASVLSVQAADEVYATVSSRVQEDWRHEIEPDAFAGDRIEEYIRMKEQKVIEEDEEEEDLSGVDFTTPFFEKFGVPRNKMEEVLMKKRIMLHAKVRLIRKAHAIQESYEREGAHLSEKMKWHDHHIEKMTPSQEEDFNHMYKERLFEMHIMTKRLTRHQELASKKFYNTLIDVLKHPQLNKFSNKKIPPPEPVNLEMTDSEKLRLARELAKAKDCCQFYTVKYVEPKEKKHKEPNKDHDHEPQQEPGDDKDDAPAQAQPTVPPTPTVE